MFDLHIPTRYGSEHRVLMNADVAPGFYIYRQVDRQLFDKPCVLLSFFGTYHGPQLSLTDR